MSHIHYREDLPDAIPYVTSYYNKNWGFCVKYSSLKFFKDEKYEVVIDSDFKDGELNYGELYLPGKSKKEIVFSTYVCHPSMANNELSGIVMSMGLINELKQNKNNFSYRFLFLPETIGSISYLYHNLNNLKKNIKCGFILTCIGNNDDFSYMPSRNGDEYIDKVIKFVLDNYVDNYNTYSYLERGSDERQFCSPNVNLPFASIMRSKYKEYKEYHTSLDNLSFIDSESLSKSLYIILKCVFVIETNSNYLTSTFCEPCYLKKFISKNRR